MPGGRFSKQAIWKGPTVLNANNSNDTYPGGTLSAVPSGLNVSQGFQTLPGDRVIFSPSDALAYCNNSIANMYTGVYRYWQFRNNSTNNVVRTKGVFLDATAFGAGGTNNNTDGQYQVTVDGNQANGNYRWFVGVAINNITLNNGTPCYWWTQEAGKAICQLRATITGASANNIGQGVYTLIGAPVGAALPANGNVDNGCFDVLEGGNIGVAFAANNANGSIYISAMIQGFVGTAETNNSSNNLNVDIPLWRTGFRW